MTTAGERDGLVAAAWAVLARSGYEGFKVHLVMREAGVSARSFYGHFTGKAHLLLALIEDEMSRSGVRLAATVAAQLAPEAMVAAWVEGILGAARSERRAARARLFSHQAALTRDFPAEMAAAQVVLTEPLRQAIVAGCEAGAFESADVDHDTQIIYALVGQLLSFCVDDPERYPVDEMVAAARTFVLRALRPADGPAPTTQHTAIHERGDP